MAWVHYQTDPDPESEAMAFRAETDVIKMLARFSLQEGERAAGGTDVEP